MDDFQIIGVGIIIAVILVGGMFALIHWDNHRMTKKFYETAKSYTTFVVNGETYKTEDIDSIEYIGHGYSSDSVVFYMENGDKVEGFASSITWKEKK